METLTITRKCRQIYFDLGHQLPTWEPVRCSSPWGLKVQNSIKQDLNPQTETLAYLNSKTPTEKAKAE